MILGKNMTYISLSNKTQILKCDKNKESPEPDYYYMSAASRFKMKC